MRSLTSPSAGNTIVDKLKTYEGGLGVDNAAAAVAVLDAVPLSSLGQPNGVAGLDASGKLYADNLPDGGVPLIHVNGPNNVNVSANGTFTITNYDMFTTYNITAIAGSFTRNKETITYTAPNTAGAGGFIINGRSINVTINGMAPNKPTLAISHSKGTNNKALATMTGSAFSTNFGANTHLNTDWEISTVSDFSSIVISSMANATNKITVSIDGLELSTTYYGRVRYRDNQGNISAYSDVFTFTTSASYVLSVEEAKLTANDKSTNDIFGNAVSIDSTGTRVVIGARSADRSNNGVTYGAAYVFVRSGTTWTQEARLDDATGGDGYSFGFSVDIDANGSRVAIGTITINRVYIFTRSGTTWTQEQWIQSADAVSTDSFGYSLSIDSTGSRIIVGAPNHLSASVVNSGAAYIFTRSGTTWTQEAKLTPADKVTGDQFGISVTIDSSGTRIASGAVGVNSGGFNNSGAVYVYIRSGTTWTQEAKVSGSTQAIGDQLGHSVSIDDAGLRIVAGAYATDESSLGDAGVVYIYFRTGTTWTQEARLVSTENFVNNNFGVSVNINGDGSLIIAAADLMDSSGIGNSGAAYVWNRNGVTWSQGSKLTASDKALNDRFGFSVSINTAGDRAISGAFANDAGGLANAGAAYIFRA